MREEVAELYKKLCRTKAPVPPEVEDAADFLQWNIDPRCIGGAARTLGMYGFAIGLGMLMVFLASYLTIYTVFELPQALLFDIMTGKLFPIIMILLPFILGYLFYYGALYYPVMLKEQLLNNILVEIPETMGYIILSLKLTPNLERALEFAVENSRGILAEKLKRLLWDIKMGKYPSAEEALDSLIYSLGERVPELKHGLMQIRSSMLEPDDTRRNVRLDNTLNEIIEGVRKKLEERASSMYMPSVQLFYLGVFLPLLLFIILPVSAVFSDVPFATLPYLVGIYLVLLPFLIYVFLTSILSRRPNIYTPPVPPPVRDRKYLYISLGILLTVLGIFYGLHLLLDTSYEDVEIYYCGYVGCLREKYGFTNWEDASYIEEVQYILSQFDLTPYWLIFGVIAAPVMAVAVYLFLTERERVKKQKHFMEMEREFKDVVYLLASKMGEGKPLEGALESVINFMPQSKLVKEVFSKTLYNIRVMGLSLKDALFHDLFGALKEVPSTFLRKATVIMTNAVELGTEIAARSLLAFSEQLRKEEEIINSIRNKLGEINVMMTSMAIFVAPVVLGITVALQQIIISSISTMETPDIPEELAYQLNINIPEIRSVEGKVASPSEFLIVSMIYNIILTALLTLYSVRVYEGNNPVILRWSLARNLTISTLVFIATAWISLSLVRGMIV